MSEITLKLSTMVGETFEYYNPQMAEIALKSPIMFLEEFFE